jgi:hypothetical protein
MPKEIQVLVLPDGRMDRRNAAAYLGYAEKTLAQWASLGIGPSYIKRGRIWYRKEELDAWTNNRLVNTNGEKPMATHDRARMKKGNARTEAMAVRFDPRSRFKLEIASRIHRRSISNFIEFAVMNTCKDVEHTSGIKFDDLIEKLWSTDLDERLKLIAKFDKNLLTFDEEMALKQCSKTA